MYTKEQVLTRLNVLLTHSKNAHLNYSEQYTALMQPVINAVNGYFSGDRSGFKKPLEDLSLYLYNDIWARGAVFEYKFEMNFNNNFPPAYSDLRKLFIEFECFNVSETSFTNAWVYETPETTETGVTPSPVPTSNTYLDSWLSTLKTAFKTELSNIEALSNFLETSTGDYNSVSLWEDQGGIIENLDTYFIAIDIYLERGFLEVIEERVNNVYIPTYIKNRKFPYWGVYK